MNKIEKPWGHETIWAHTKDYVGKILHINKNHRLSRQYHQHKEETFLVQSGELTLQIGMPVEQTYTLTTGQSFHCPPKMIHRMVADKDDVDVIEVSTPQLEDVIRLEDDYNRIEK